MARWWGLTCWGSGGGGTPLGGGGGPSAAHSVTMHKQASNRANQVKWTWVGLQLLQAVLQVC